MDLRIVERLHRPNNLSPEGHEPIRVKAFVVVEEHCPKVALRKTARVDQFVLDDVDAAQKGLDSSEEPPAPEPLPQSELRCFPVQKVDELVLIKRRVCLVLRDVSLQEAVAVGVDSADEQSAELVGGTLAESGGSPLPDSPLELLGRLLREGEGHDTFRRLGLEERGDPLGHDLGLASARRSDDLNV